MAVLSAPKDFGPELGELAPAGTYVGVCFAVIDEFGVDKFDKVKNKAYKANETKFFFGFKGKDGKYYKVRSKPYTLSLAQTAGLPKFLSGWGVDPKPGLNTQELIGRGAMLTVVHNKPADKTYANVTSVGPVIEELEGKIPPVSAFNTPPAPAKVDAPF